MLVKLKLWVDFTNILQAAFMGTDPKSTKRHWRLDWIFALLGSAQVKAACKHVCKIDTWYERAPTGVFRRDWVQLLLLPRQ
jgi:hypothetical protein